MVRYGISAIFVVVMLAAGVATAGYTNFEVSHVHPIALTPDGTRLLAVNTPDARLELFDVQPDGSLTPAGSVPVGLEPVTVVPRTDDEAWVVNHLSDSISIVDLALGRVTRTLRVGDEPTDVAFAAGKAFVTASTQNAVHVYALANLDTAPSVVSLFGKDVRALAVSGDGQSVYAVVLRSGNQTTVLGVRQTFPDSTSLEQDPARLDAMGLSRLQCDGPSPPYPPLPTGITRDEELIDPPSGVPEVGLIVQWNEVAGEWQDEAGQDWSHCLPYRLPDEDLFRIDTGTLAVTAIPHLGTTLFDVSVHPVNGKIYVANTDARNAVRFEHPLGVQGHVVDNRLSVVDPGNGNTVTRIDLNTHIDRSSDPVTNLGEREASISQPGMIAWRSDGSAAYLTAIGSRKLFRVVGSCMSGACIFGADRSSPDAVEVGDGPTGVALLERPDPAQDRLYVLNRIASSIVTVDAATMTRIDERVLHDPSSDTTRMGRRLLYDAIDTSGHGDAACSSCHISGDLDGLSWDLGNPEGEFATYGETADNVRFGFGVGGNFVDCPIGVFACNAHEGFDPQKGPMTTQTLRGMLEPLHWRGDRATFASFNGAFPDLMGTADIGPIDGKPAGLTSKAMNLFRDFALAITYPPNPYRNADDTTPCGSRAMDPGCEVQVTDMLLPGNPTEGRILFDTHPSDGLPAQPCSSCHTHPFGAGGGTLGGVTPTMPTSFDTAALFNGTLDGSPHSDVKVPHLRNMYDKAGPVLPAAGEMAFPPTRVGFGYLHDGSSPDLYRFLSATVFQLSAANQARQIRDLVAFMFYFPTGTRPAVGQQLTVASGVPPTGTADEEALLSILISVGDLADAGRHCELVASAEFAGRLRGFHLSGGNWITDSQGESPLTTVQLRENAGGEVTFLCTPIDSGERLGGNRDEDPTLDGDDCASADPETWRDPQSVDDLALDGTGTTTLSWSEQGSSAGPSIRYEVLAGDLSALRGGGVGVSTCLQGDLAGGLFADDRPALIQGEGGYCRARAARPVRLGGRAPPGRRSTR